MGRVLYYYQNLFTEALKCVLQKYTYNNPVS